MTVAASPLRKGGYGVARAEATSSSDDSDTDLANFLRDRVDDAAGLRFPELFVHHAPNLEPIYDLANRNGIGIVALRTPALSKE
jgi:hypothetical protein